MFYIIATMSIFAIMALFLFSAKTFIKYYRIHKELLLYEYFSNSIITLNITTILTSHQMKSIKNEIKDNEKFMEIISCRRYSNSKTTESDLKHYLSVMNLALFCYAFQLTPPEGYIRLLQKELVEIRANRLLYVYILDHRTEYDKLIGALKKTKIDVDFLRK